MISYASHVMTLANSIIGVSVLAMPYCFKQCGFILASLVLVLCCLLSRLACHFLIKSAVMSRRRNYEFLAFHAFGPMGKFLVELLIIGFLMGTCIAFFVVVGDLGPQILGKILNKNSEDIRASFLLTTGALVVFPLGLLRNIDSLASICTVTIGFYLCLVLKVIVESMGHIFREDWYDNVNYWRPAGILQCLPIFSMALSCQTQLFEIYESIENVSLEKMNTVVRGAMNICTLVYLCVGFFGYIAFCTQPFSGNILMHFEPSLTADAIKIGFVLSVAFSFPLVIFPCRASLNSLFFRRVYLHETASNYIPETRFKCLTFTIVTVSLIIGLIMPNIEFVLGLVGSTIGVMICLIFPAGFFIAISTKNTNERLVAQVILFIGMWIMILGSYANLYAIEESSTTRISVVTDKPFIPIDNIHIGDINDHPRILSQLEIRAKDNGLEINKEADKSLDTGQIWHDPSIQAVERPIVIDNPVINIEEKLLNISAKLEIKKLPKKLKISNKILKMDDKFFNSNNNVNNNINNKSADKIVNNSMNNSEKIKPIEQSIHKEINNKGQQINDDTINVDAIKKEDSEIADAAVVPPELKPIDADKMSEKLDNVNVNNDDKNTKINNEDIHIKGKLNSERQLNSSDNKLMTKIQEKRELNESNIVNDNNYNKSDGEKKESYLPQENVPLKSRGLVLDALTNWTSNVSNSINNNVLKNNNIINNLVINNNTNNNKNNKIPENDNIKNEINNNNKDEFLNDNSNKKLLSNNYINKREDQSISKMSQYPLPIALKLINQSKESENTKFDTVDAESKIKSDGNEASAIRRDILEDHVRDKRDANNDNNIDNDKKTIKSAERTLDVKSNVLMAFNVNNETVSCVKNESGTFIVEDLSSENSNKNNYNNIDNTANDNNTDNNITTNNDNNININNIIMQSTVETIIRTSSYLTDEKFVNGINLNEDLAMNPEYHIVKKRDLKGLKSN